MVTHVRCPISELHPDRSEFLEAGTRHLKHATHYQNEIFLSRCFNRLFVSRALTNQNELLSRQKC